MVQDGLAKPAMAYIQSVMLHPSVAPIGCGVIAHAFTHYHAPASISAFATILFLPPLVVSLLLPSTSLALSFFHTLVLYLASLMISVATYRLSPFHPLAQYPGPVFARVSRLWAMRVAAGGHQHLVSHFLFERYGDVVRTGPNHLIIRDPRAIPTVLGPKQPWHRHTRYEVLSPHGSPENMLRLLDPAEHSKRRKLWDRAFTPSALKSYQPMLSARVAELRAHLLSRAGAPLDLASWMGWLATDFMGDFAWGGAFALMTAGADKDDVHGLGVGMLRKTEVFGTAPWVRPLSAGYPARWLALTTRAVRTRMERGSAFRDLFHYLLDEDKESTQPPLPMPTLASEAALAIIAGSDTTSTALAGAMFYMLTHPAALVRLRAELDSAAAGAALDIEIEADRLAKLPFLQAVIDETLRLQPAIPNGVQRMPPPDGGPVVVAGHVVPVGTAIQIPTYSLQRDRRHFSPDPDAFLPERWLPDEGPKIAAAAGQEYKLNQGAYMPFNYGPANCVGRALALHEMRAALAMLVRGFDVQFAPGFAPEQWTSGLRDVYILTRGKLDVVITARSVA